MKLADTNYDNAKTGCCAPVDPAMWDEKDITWHDKLFLKDHIRSVLHVPVNMGAVMSRDQLAIENAAAYPADPLWLSDDVSPWGSDLFVAVDHPVPGTDTVAISGHFLTKMFEGPYGDVGKWLQATDDFVHARGHTVRRHLLYYATCPKCAKVLGKNQVVVFAEVD